MVDAISTSQARRAGITRSQLRSQSWTRVHHGVYRRTVDGPVDDDGLERRMRDVHPALTHGERFAHLCAAHLHGLWLPTLPPWLATQVTLPPGADRPKQKGVYAFRSRAGEQGHRTVRGLPVVTPQICIGQLAEDLSVLDLTIAIDSALHLGLCTRIDIENAIRSRQRGLPRLRRALTLCDRRSESAWETILRLIHVAAGFDVEPQHEIRNELGVIVARGDLWLIGTNRLSEYDGAVHRDRQQHESDLRRDKILTRLGLERFGYIATELIEHPVQVIRDAESALHLPHDPRRIVAWNELADPSVLTTTGKRRLLYRLHRFD